MPTGGAVLACRIDRLETSDPLLIRLINEEMFVFKAVMFKSASASQFIKLIRFCLCDVILDNFVRVLHYLIIFFSYLQKKL